MAQPGAPAVTPALDDVSAAGWFREETPEEEVEKRWEKLRHKSASSRAAPEGLAEDARVTRSWHAQQARPSRHAAQQPLHWEHLQGISYAQEPQMASDRRTGLARDLPDAGPSAQPAWASPGTSPRSARPSLAPAHVAAQTIVQAPPRSSHAPAHAAAQTKVQAPPRVINAPATEQRMPMSRTHHRGSIDPWTEARDVPAPPALSRKAHVAADHALRGHLYPVRDDDFHPVYDDETPMDAPTARYAAGSLSGWVTAGGMATGHAPPDAFAHHRAVSERTAIEQSTQTYSPPRARPSPYSATRDGAAGAPPHAPAPPRARPRPPQRPGPPAPHFQPQTDPWGPPAPGGWGAPPRRMFERADPVPSPVAGSRRVVELLDHGAPRRTVELRGRTAGQRGRTVELAGPGEGRFAGRRVQEDVEIREEIVVGNGRGVAKLVQDGDAEIREEIPLMKRRKKEEEEQDTTREARGGPLTRVIR